MGTTLHGIVEWENGRGGWEAVAQIEFNKNYEFMSVLHEHAEGLWPPNPGWTAKLLLDKGTADSGKTWCTLDVLVALLSIDPDPDGYEASDAEESGSKATDGLRHWSRHRPFATATFMRVLEREGAGNKTRILFYNR